MNPRPRADGTLVGGQDDQPGDAAPAGSVAADGTAADAGSSAPGEVTTPATADGHDGGDAAPGDPVPGDGDDTARRRAERRRTAASVAIVTAVLALPIVIAAIAVRSPRWYPLVDMAQIELRVRDVGTGHPPLVGLGGRIFGLDTQGAHPGPLSFYLLAPGYWLLGGNAWALQASAAVLNVGALAATVWATHRRWGLRGALLIAVGLALAMRIWGTTVLVYPWNPYMPVLFWMLFLVCVWGVLCDDLPLVPVAVVAGSLCAQTHIPYTGMVGGLGLVMIVSLVLAYRRAGHGDSPVTRRAVVRWSAAGVVLGALIWLPVVIEELRGDPGNLSIIFDSFGHAEEPVVGFGTAWNLLVEHLNPLRLLQGDRSGNGDVARWPGYLLLAAWVAAVATAVRLRARTLVGLHFVVGAALVLGLVSISRILGVTWFYLTLWAFGTAALVLVAVLATAGALVRAEVARRGAGERVAHLAWLPAALLAMAALWPTLLLARAAPDTEDSDAAASSDLGQVVQPTVDAIEDGTVAGGAGGTLMITWVDPVNLGGQGLGMLLELERRGYDAAAPVPYRLAVRHHRLVRPARADAEIHVATGVPANLQAAAHPGSQRIAFYDPRTPEQQAYYDRLHDAIVDRLEDDDLEELLPLLNSNFILLASDDRAPDDVKSALFVMGRLPQPIGVYTWSPV